MPLAVAQHHSLTESPALERVDARLQLSFVGHATGTRLGRLHQAGGAKAKFPRVAPGDPPEAVLFNLGGGLTGGDRVALELKWGEGARATATSQACEKIYRASAGEARIETRLSVAAGAEAEWLPQETILYDGARLVRSLDVEMAADARLLLCEGVVLGRTAMGERLRTGAVFDRWRVRRDGRLVYADGIRLGGDIESLTARKASLAGAACFATVLLLAPDAEAHLESVRQGLESARGEVAASAWNNMLLIRFIALTGADLRFHLTQSLNILRGRPLPRVWTT